MSTTDSIGDMLSRIRNAMMAQHDVVEAIYSGLAVEIAKILKREGYIGDYGVETVERRRHLRLHLKYVKDREPAIRGLRRLSRQGLRRYVKVTEIPRSVGGLGTVILSTPGGVMTDRDAREKNVGGELLCEVW
jgi:small subunit ribosomal protein S8